jgi:3-dehydroquinate dehydratase
MERNICIVIPINSTIFDTNSRHIIKVNDEKPEFIELRFDFIDKVDKISLEFINKLKSIINPEISTLLY